MIRRLVPIALAATIATLALFLANPFNAHAAPLIPGAVLSIGYPDNDLGQMQVRQYSKSGVLLDTVLSTTPNVDPRGITVIGQTVWIHEISDAGATVGTFDMTTGVYNKASTLYSFLDGYSNPLGFANLGGDLLVTSYAGEVIRYQLNEERTFLFDAPGNYRGVTTDGTNIFLANSGTGFIDKYTTSGVLLSSLDTGLGTLGDIAYDATDGSFFAAKGGNPSSITHISATGTNLGSFNVPEGTNFGIEVVAIPEGSALSFVLPALGMIGFTVLRKRKK